MSIADANAIVASRLRFLDDVARDALVRAFIGLRRAQQHLVLAACAPRWRRRVEEALASALAPDRLVEEVDADDPERWLEFLRGADPPGPPRVWLVRYTRLDATLADLNLARDYVIHQDRRVWLWLPHEGIPAAARFAPDLWRYRSATLHLPFADRVRTIRPATHLLDARGETRVVLVQAPPPALSRDELDPPRPAVAGVLRALAGLADHTSPALVVAPELSIGTNVAEVDRALVGLPGTVVVVAGLGFCAPAVVAPWFEATWAPDERANVGLVWVWDRGVLWHELFVKNHFEQHVEKALLPAAHKGDWTLRLDFDDVSVFPLICADLLADGPGSPRWRINAHLVDRPAVGGRALVVAPLLTHEPGHDIWRGALQRWSGVPAEHVRIITVNHAAPTPTTLDADPSRRLTGVWWPRADHADEREPNQHSRGCAGAAVVGRVVRRVEPTVVAGPLHFTRGSTLVGRSPWSPERADALDGSALVDPWVYELARALGPPLGGKVAAATGGRSAVAQRVALGLTDGGAVVQRPSWPDGVRDDACVGRAADSLHFLADGHAEPALADDPAPLARSGVGLLVWCDPARKGGVIGREVANWSRRTGGRPLVLFTDPPVLDASLTRPAITDPAPRGSRITEPRPRAFRVVPLAALEDCRDADDPVGAARALLSTCLAELGRSDPPGSEESPG